MNEIPVIESIESILARHKKEVKQLDGEKRAALKKVKSLKGQKAKDQTIAYVRRQL
jgi:uncharacterized coiled-coil protein SlyX